MPRILALIWLSVVVFGDGDGVTAQPRLFARPDGSLVLAAAIDRNITVRLSRNSIWQVNDVNVLETLRELYKHPSVVSAPGDNDLTENVSALRRDLLRLKATVLNLQRSGGRSWNGVRSRRLAARTQRLLTAVSMVENDLAKDQCDGSPCKNGGTCYNGYKKFYCDCMDGWTGATCSDDLDECYMLAGTELGCQNGGVCVNSMGSYRCVCRDGYTGTHCRSKTTLCTLDGGEASICGHGSCIRSRDELGYTCICDQGWTKNNATPSCVIDVNECDTDLKNPCHSECINLPGSFKCAPCPTGYIGDGVNCYDIDECETDNGGCSSMPWVRCINTQGSYHCGNCPFGWIGDGRKCDLQPSNSCNSENICHPGAKCEYISEAAVCTCPPGMYGHGFGPNGCTSHVTTSPCANHECRNNGTCVALARGTRCVCQSGFMGPLCEEADACQAEPCQNGGTCILLPNNKYRCGCPQGTTGNNCEVMRQICGTTIRRPSGEISYPPDGVASYDSNERCAWIIRTNSSMVLDVTFAHFDVESTPDCNKDWLQIHDGRTLASRLIGRFCGQSMPGDGHVRSSNEQLFFWFRSDNSTNRSGFKMSWTSVTEQCSQRVALQADSHGVIQSPGYPGAAPANKMCDWQLEAPYSYRFVLRFYDLTLGHSEWRNDTLTIYDSDLLLRRMTQSSQLEPIHTSSNKAAIHFYTDQYQTNSRFQLHYEVVPGIPHCGGMFTEPTGIITGYMDAEVCLYLIQQPAGLRIKLEFLNFKLLSSEDCNLQKLEIFDGKTDKDPLIKRLCGSRATLDPLISNGNAMLLRYEYTLSGIKLSKNFQVKYSRVCDAEFRSTDGGIITTPNYPNAYMDYITCTYTIIAPVDHVVNINITDFSITPSGVGSVMIPSGQGSPKTEIQENYMDIQLSEMTTRYYDIDPPLLLTSDKNRMRLVFHSDANTRKAQGLRIEYSFQRIRCGGVLTGTKGGFTHVGEGNKFCEWIIEAPEDMQIELFLKSFHYFGEVAEEPYIYIYSNATGRMGDLLGSYKDDMEFSETIHSNLITILMKPMTKTMITFIRGSFQLVHSSACGGDSSSGFGVIKSPSWPQRYGPNSNCTWTITAPLGHKIELSVHAFTLENTTSNCWNDFLTIRNGHSPDSPLIGTYCGTDIPSRIPSFTNSLYVHFQSDESISTSGFYITWHQTETGCGGKLTSYEGSIHPPHRGDQYGSVACDWQIMVAQGSRIELNLVSKTGNAPDLYIYNGATTLATPLLLDWQTADDYQSRTATLTTTGNQALVVLQFKTLTSNDFILNYRSICNFEFTGVQGVLESPNFPDNYPPGLHCRWEIRGGRHNKISLAFSHLSVEHTNFTCDYDYVEIADMRNDEELTKRRLCSMPPDVITSEGNRLLVTFMTDYSYAQGGFRAEFKRLGCGEHITKLTGQINTPNAPFSVDLQCDWFIEVPAGKRIQFQFTDMELSHLNNCSRNEILVAEDQYSNSTLPLFKECGSYDRSSLPVRITSPANRLYISFRSGEERERTFFKANYFVVSSNCGGISSGRSGVIASPNYPDKFASNVECVWNINVDDTYAVKLRFDVFNLTVSEGCKDAYVEVSSAKQTDFKLQLCGIQPPPAHRVLGNEITVTFAANTKGWGKFVMHYERECGGELTEAIGYIRARPNEQCTWVINAPDASEIIFDILHLECLCPSKCDDVNLTISNDNDGTVLSRMCELSPANLILPSNKLRISANNVDLYARYSTLQNTCGGTITSAFGVLASPKYPNSYPPDVSCEWDIQGIRGTFITVRFEDLGITTSEHCNGDFLELRESNKGGRLLGMYCSNDTPMDDLKAFERLWVKFRSVAGSSGKGFKMKWSLTENNEINGTLGVIETPPHNLFEIYTWRIMAALGQVIAIDFREYNGGLQLYDGYTEEALSVEIQNSPWSFTSSSNVVFLKNVQGANFDNFRLEWHSLSSKVITSNLTESTCGDTLTITSKIFVNISSPGYPNGYAPNLNCVWILKPAEKIDHISFDLYDAKMEEYNSDCSADYLEVFSSSNLIDWHQEARICNTEGKAQNVQGTPYLKLIFHSDIAVAGTGFTSLAKAECGSNLTSSVGTIHESDVMRYWRNSSCEWHIEVRPGRVIEFTIDYPSTAISNKSDCGRYAIIYDGLDQSAHILEPGHLCNRRGNNVKSLRTSSHHAVVKYFYTDRTVDWNRKWNMTYREYSECNNEIRLTHLANAVNISSPRYPNVPHPHTECTWTFVAPPGETLEGTFVDRFSMNWHQCNKEYVEIFDGTTALARSLGHYCVKSIQVLRSTSNVLYVRYLTDVPEPRNGFRLNVKLATCGGVYTTRSGVFTSPNYPNAYGRQVCEYTIRLPRNTAGIHLNFTDISLPFDPLKGSDKQDRIEVVYLDAEETSLGVFYGNGQASSTMDVDGNVVLVRFRSFQMSPNYRGFKLSYRTSSTPCYKNVQGDSGTLTFNNQTTSFMLCQWKITVPKGQRVKFQFLAMEGDITPNRVNPTRTPSLFAFFNDARLSSKIIDLRWMDVNASTIIESTDNVMIVRLAIGYAGYKISRLEAAYSSENPSPCPSEVDVRSHGTINLNSLQDFDKFYCDVRFRVNNVGETISFDFKQLDYTQPSPTNTTLIFARKSPVRIVDALDPIQAFAAIIGPTTKTHASSSSGSIIVQQNFPNEIKAFSLEYQRFACGGVYKLQNGVSLDLPRVIGVANTKLDCCWTLMGSNRVQPYKVLANISFAEPCEREYIAFYTREWRETDRICRDRTAPTDINTLQLRIVYHAETYQPDLTSFTLTFEQAILCNDKRFVDTQEQTVTVNASQYKNNMECSWEFHTSNGFYLTLEFRDRFFIENAANCTNDHLELQTYVGGLWMPQQRFCGRDIPLVHNTTANRLRMIFRTNDAILGDGFTFAISRRCGLTVNVTAEKQTIQVPFNYNLINMHCEYVFQSDSAALFNVRIQNVGMSTDLIRPPVGGTPVFVSSSVSNGLCKWVVFTLFKLDGLGELMELGKYCDTVELSANKYMKLVYDSIFSKHFIIEYSLNLCGGNFTTPKMIRPPKDKEFDTYLTDMDCVWSFTAPPEHSVVVRFDYLEMETNCYDYVALYEGHAVRQDKLVGKYCSKAILEKNPRTVMVDTNEAIIRAISDGSLQYKGFQAYVYFTRNCNERITLTEGNSPVTLSRHFDVNATETMLCHYNVIAPEGYRVKVLLKELNVNTARCRDVLSCNSNCNYVEVFNSVTDDGNSLGKRCTNGRPMMSFISSYADAVVVFGATETGQWSFEIALQMEVVDCGSQTVINIPEGQIITLIYPWLAANTSTMQYPSNAHCSWSVQSEKELEVYFTRAELQPPSEVTGQCLDYIFVKDALMKKYFCGNSTGVRLTTGVSTEISFHSDDEIENKGFTINIFQRRYCNTTYTTPSGLVNVLFYQHGQNDCDNEIRLPDDQQISIYMKISIFSNTNCSRGYFKIEDISNRSSMTNTTLMHICDRSYFDTKLITTSNALRIRAHMYSMLQYFYVSNHRDLPPGCGGRIESLEGFIINPPYDNDRNASECRWALIVPPPNRIEIYFQNFDMGSKVNCPTDYFSILEIQSNGSERTVRTFCGTDEPQTYVTQTSQVILLSKKSPNFDGIGWTVHFALREEPFE